MKLKTETSINLQNFKMTTVQKVKCLEVSLPLDLHISVTQRHAR